MGVVGVALSAGLVVTTGGSVGVGSPASVLVGEGVTVSETFAAYLAGDWL